MSTGGTLKVGLIVNPVAGIGGPAGLKGSDGADIVWRARSLGIASQAAGRVRRALGVLLGKTGTKGKIGDLSLLVAAGAMGGDVVVELGLAATTVHKPQAADTQAADTREAALAMRRTGAELIMFAGGDGTARDVLDAIGESIPVIGIPCGVKMHSGAFAAGPEAAGYLLREVIERQRGNGGNAGIPTDPAEVMDIDEDALRAGRLNAQLYGYLMCPRGAARLQGPKARGLESHDSAVEEAAAKVARTMVHDRIYLIGPGRSANAVLSALGMTGTLLGVDAVHGGKLVGSDLNAAEISRLAAHKPVAIVLGVIGGQGYIFGRGNQQLGPGVVRACGRDNLIVISSERKLAGLTGGRLYADTGDLALDRALQGFIRVHTGAGRSMLMQLCPG